MADSAHITNPITPFNALRLSPFGCPAGVDPSFWRQALRKRIDANLAAVEALLAALDGMTPDCDLEDDGTENDVATPHRWQPMARDQHEDDEAAADREPNLGWCPTQYWEHQGRIALERDRDEREVDHDFEEVNEDGGNILDGGHDSAFGGGTFVVTGNGSGEL